jgi:hypothetical protein
VAAKDHSPRLQTANFSTTILTMTGVPNNSPEPPPMGAVSPPSRLTVWTARL